jgi:hypothetical protein
MSLAVYVLSWKRVSQNAIKIFENISKVKKDVYFLNCDENLSYTGDNVITCDDSYYYVKQFHTCVRHCIENHKDSYMMTITGDVGSDANWQDVFDRTLYGFQNLNAGVIGPNVNWTFHSHRFDEIENNFWNVNNTDCTVWALSPKIYNFILTFELEKWMKFGWGIDYIGVEYAKKCNLHVIRDYNNTIIHPQETGYVSNDAAHEYQKLLHIYNAKMSCGSE